MTRGRRPKPIEVHKRNGTYRPDRHGQGPMLEVAPLLKVVGVVDRFVDNDGLICEKCEREIVLEILNTGSWRQLHMRGRGDCDAD